ncbi:MAG: adenylyl-sulfate kinase [Gammaproteobacteria bacterium]|nr:MAG: adenylyl-sulfate kinase [Gammaproteobacteria bacterium]
MKDENIVWHEHNLSKAERSQQKRQKPCILWYTGLSGSGKSTIAGAVEKKLFELGHHTYLLDGDNVRHGLNKDLGFSDEDRIENIRRIGEMAALFADAGLLVLSAFISPFRSDRKMVRELVEEAEFIEIFMDTPLDVCEQRDPKGLYKKARKGEIKNFTGIDSTYEAPECAEITINTATDSVESCVNKVIGYLQANNIIVN